MNDPKWKAVLLKAAMEANAHLRLITGGAEIETQGAEFGALNNDTEIKADIVIGELMIEFFKKVPGVGWIVVEGVKDPVRVNPNGSVIVYVDPLDGSLDYLTAVKFGKRLLGLPFTHVITVMESPNPETPHVFGQTLATIMMELGQEVAVLAERGFGTEICFKPNNGEAVDMIPAKPFSNPDTEAGIVNPGSSILVLENYYPENRAVMFKAFTGKKGYIRSVGSAAWEMAMVAIGNVAAYACSTQKGHESAAAWLLVTEAGGSAVTWSGKPLADEIHQFNAQKDVIFACNEKLALSLAEVLSEAKNKI